MQTPATPEWLPSHLAVNSAHLAICKETVRTWSGNEEQPLATTKLLPPHLAVNSAHAAHCQQAVSKV